MLHSPRQEQDLLLFYLGKSIDHGGRTIDQIWSWDHQKLEHTHDFIQWLFPNEHQSPFNPEAPTLDGSVIDSFRSDQELKNRLLISFKLMLGFYGLRCMVAGEEICISKAGNYEELKLNWLNRANHNYRRITRILVCLKTLGLEEYANAFLQALEQISAEEGEKIGSTTLSHWRAAVI